MKPGLGGGRRNSIQTPVRSPSTTRSTPTQPGAGPRSLETRKADKLDKPEKPEKPDKPDEPDEPDEPDN